MAQNIIREDDKQREARAREWKRFRRDYLFSQSALAEALGICLRTVQVVESGGTTPHINTLRRFRDLKREQERMAEA